MPPEIREIDYFREVSSLNVTLQGTGSFQGVASDANNLYASSTQYLYKYNGLTGALVSSRNVSGDGTTTGHVGDIFVKDGIIYAATSNYAATPKASYMVRWNASNLSFIDETLISTSEWNSTVTHHDGYWWMVLYSGKIAKLDETTFAIIDIYDIPVDIENGNYNFDGMDWVNDMLYLNPHENVHPQATQQFYFDGTKFIHCRSVIHPRECTQGIDYVPATGLMLFMRRGTNQIVFTRMEPDDKRHLSVGYDGQTNTNVQTTSQTYVEEGTLSAELFVKKGDIVEANMTGIYRLLAANHALRAYIDVSGSSAVAMTLLTGGESMRTQNYNNEGTTLSQTKLFRAEADGIAKFGHFWKVMGAGQTARRESGSIILKIAGRELN